MGKFINLKGSRFGRLIVLERAENGNCRQVRWLCKCDCGNLHYASTAALRAGKVQSCGCLNKDAHATHGMSYSRIYIIWAGMKRRCLKKSHKHYDKYGGRNITICEDWLNFDNFCKWANENGYEDNLTLDRIDNDGNYEPSNCRWITMAEQQRNKSNTRYLTCNGITKPMLQWAEELGVSKKTMRNRLDAGWSDAQILFGKKHATT